MPGTVMLVTGGARSGKSRYALQVVRRYARRVFLATAEALDGEMVERIAKHKAERGEEFLTIEEPVDLAGALARMPARTDVALVDCLTVWLGNLLHREPTIDIHAPAIQQFLAAIDRPPCDLVLVTNEVGLGIVPDNPMARQFRDMAGTLNQEVAARARSVVFLACGLPIAMKGSPRNDT